MQHLNTIESQNAILAYIVDELNNEKQELNKMLDEINSIEKYISFFHLVNLKIG